MASSQPPKRMTVVAETVAPNEALERVLVPFEATDPCPLCGEAFVHAVPGWVDKTKGLAYPSLLMHFMAEHPWIQPPPPAV